MRKAAVIGCGRMGAFTSESVRRFSPPCWFPLAHAEAIAAHPELELAALCDADPHNLERARAAYGNPPGYADFRALAEEIRPELAGIATRTIGRADIIQTLHAHGTRAFHIEKPLCSSVAELEVLTPLLESPDVFATYGTIRRFFHIYRAARDLARSGRFGRLLEIRANFGPGALYWTQPHAIDLILFAAEGRQVAGVQARFDRLHAGDAPDEVLNDPVIQSATIWFDDGVAGHIGRAPGLDLVLSCEVGEVTVTSDGRAILIAEARGKDPYLVREPWTEPVPGDGSEGTLAPIAQLAACLAGDPQAVAENAILKRDILRGQRIAFAMIESHRRASAFTPVADLRPELRIAARNGDNYA